MENSIQNKNDSGKKKEKEIVTDGEVNALNIFADQFNMFNRQLQTNVNQSNVRMKCECIVDFCGPPVRFFFFSSSFSFQSLCSAFHFQI